MAYKTKKKYPWNVTWEERAKLALKFVPESASILDIGGGQGIIYKLRGGKYTSIDVAKWNDKTVVADLNKEEYPELPKHDYILCLGVLEYIEKEGTFLETIKKYGDKVILSYRTNSKGGIERANYFTFYEIEKIVIELGYEIISIVNKSSIERIFLLEVKNGDN